jgi:hypothetical protein
MKDDAFGDMMKEQAGKGLEQKHDLKTYLKHLKVEKGIPIPEDPRKKTSLWDEFVKGMKVGDSVESAYGLWSVLKHLKLQGKKGVMRRNPKTGNNRVWRVE